MGASDSLGAVSVGGLTGDYRYGPAESREPPRASTVFKIDPAVPTGLAVLQAGVLSDAAKSFPFVKAPYCVPRRSEGQRSVNPVARSPVERASASEAPGFSVVLPTTSRPFPGRASVRERRSGVQRRPPNHP
jgi:hypothetical protein